MTMLEWLFSMHEICHFQSIEKPGVASKSELRRWIANGAIEINHWKYQANEELPMIVTAIMFPNGKRRSTLVWNLQPGEHFISIKDAP